MGQTAHRSGDDAARDARHGLSGDVVEMNWKFFIGASILTAGLMLKVAPIWVVATGLALATRIHQPSVFGEILVGLILGPTLLNVLGWPIFTPPAGAAGVPLLDLVRDLAQLGVLFLMFVAGLETDLVMMRHVGKVAFWSALGGVVLPMIFGAMTAVAFGLPLYWEGIFIGAILTATSVSISAHTRLERR